MRVSKTIILGAALAVACGAAQAGPQQDLKAFQKHFMDSFPGVAFDEFGNGIYGINKERRAEWEQMEEFPDYELSIDKGKERFNKPFADGKGYADCFPNYKQGIKQNYPYFDKARGQVMTLEWAINLCRKKHGEKPLKYAKTPIAQISAYLAYLSRGKKIHVVIPDDPRALKAYNEGKRFFYSKRGQLNFSCANCHIQGAGKLVRANILSPALGQVSHFPVYRKKWGGVGTLHRRYKGCNKQVRAKPFKPQGRVYRNLEYFHTYMSNGIALNGPGERQ